MEEGSGAAKAIAATHVLGAFERLNDFMEMPHGRDPGPGAEAVFAGYLGVGAEEAAGLPVGPRAGPEAHRGSPPRIFSSGAFGRPSWPRAWPRRRARAPAGAAPRTGGSPCDSAVRPGNAPTARRAGQQCCPTRTAGAGRKPTTPAPPPASP